MAFIANTGIALSPTAVRTLSAVARVSFLVSGPPTPTPVTQGQIWPRPKQ